MSQYFNQLLKKATATVALLAIFSSFSIQAAFAAPVPPVISGTTVSKMKINPAGWETTVFHFELNTPATVTVSTWRKNSAGVDTFVKDFLYNQFLGDGGYNIEWDGSDDLGNTVSNGFYYFKVYASSTDGSTTLATVFTSPASPNITVESLAPVLSSVSAVPASFDLLTPSATKPNIHFELNTSAKVSVSILQGLTTIKNIVTNKISTGPRGYDYVWNLDNNFGATVSPGTYQYKISAFNDAVSVPVERTGDIVVSSGSVAADPVFTSFSVSPSSFNADASGAFVTLNYAVNVPAFVKVDVWSVGPTGTLAFVTTLTASDYKLVSPLSGSLNWYGVAGGSKVPAGTYFFHLVASKTAGGSGGDSKSTTTFQVTRGPVDELPVISSVTVNRSTFNPDNAEQVTLRYYLNMAAYVTVDVLRDGTLTLVRTLTPTGYYFSAAGFESFNWNGKDNNAERVSAGNYIFRIRASKTLGGVSRMENSPAVEINYGASPAAGVKVSNVYASLTTFNPNTQDTVLYYTLDRSADFANVEVRDSSGVLVRTLTGTKASGANNISWNGRNSSGAILSEGTYTFRVNAGNAYGSDSKTNTVVVSYGTATGLPVLSNLFAVPATFNPNLESTTLTYTLDRPAAVTLQVIRSGSTVVRTLESNINHGSGTSHVIWSGRDDNGSLVSDGFYTFRVVASNAYGSDARNGSVRVSPGGRDTISGSIIRNLFVNPEVFNPSRGESSSVYFNFEKAANFTTEILDLRGNVIRTLTDNVYRNPVLTTPYYTGFGGYQYSDSWNGRDRNGNIVSDNVYQFRVRAYTSAGESDTRTAYVEVDTNGVIVGFPGNVNCVGFRDVTRFSPYCEAIKVMKEDGVFSGYPDGTFRPYQAINRAETTKVILMSLRTPMAADTGSVGFSDVSNNVWYANYLRTAKRLGIIRGYPDGMFRPVQTVNRVELLKIFLESVAARIGYCNTAPYFDTPINTNTRWYIDYVCYAKNNNLMRDDGNDRFNPATPMTRGDVADLFYQYEAKGLYTGTAGTTYSRY